MSKPIDITDKSFKAQVLDAEGPVLVDFGPHGVVLAA